MDFLDNIDKETIIICHHDVKTEILKSQASNSKILPVKFMSLNELVQKYYFGFTDEAYLYIVKKYHVKYDIAKVYMQNLYYVEDKVYGYEKLDFLVRLKKELIEQNLLIVDDNFVQYLKGKDIIVYHFNYFDSFYEHIFDQLSSVCNVKFIDKNYGSYLPKVYQFSTLEEEVSFVASSICELLEKGIAIHHIKLTNVNDDYFHILEKVFSFYHLKINFKGNHSILSSLISEYFLDHYESDIEHTIALLKDKYGNCEVVHKIISICNKYVMVDDFLEVKELIINDLKNTKFDVPIYQDGIEIIDYMNDLISDEDYVFMLGFNQGVIPKIYKDEAYITDDLKFKLFMDTTAVLNKKEKLASIGNIRSIKNLIITYKERNSFRTFYPSFLIQEMGLVVFSPEDSSVSYSKEYDEILLAIYLDDFIKYGICHDRLGLYFSSYQIPYLTFNNKFGGIDKESLYQYLDHKINLSYTSLDNYFKCHFKYYLDSILKLNIYEEKLATFIGNLFHHILEIGLTHEIDFDDEFEKYVHDAPRSFTHKDLFFIHKLKGELKFTLDTIREQMKLSSLDHYLFEEKVVVRYHDKVSITFSGKIDKIVYDEKDGYTIVALVDYKTGDTTCDLKYLPYGLHMQLPIYLYLVKNNPKLSNVVFAGFYLQKILNKQVVIDTKKDFDTLRKDQLKLFGYSNSNEEVLHYFDRSYKDSELISGMGVKLDGNFKATSKILSNDKINRLVEFSESKIKEASDSIIQGDFRITPKKNEKGEIISCKFCQYKDICFRTEEDFEEIIPDSDLTFLGGDDDVLD